MPLLKAIDEIVAAAYREDEYPVCACEAREWASTRPFAGLTILDATPVFRNTLVKYRALLAAGARLIVGRTENIRGDDKIVAQLRECGVIVVDPTSPPGETVDVVLDCAASFIDWPSRIGVVELTRSGVPKYAASGARVFVADSGRIKKIETCLGTGESYFRAMRKLGYSDWRGRKLVIFGSGKVGTGLLTYASANGAESVVITEPSTATAQTRRMAARIVDCDDIEAVVAEIADAFAVVTATGVAAALDQPRIVEALQRSSAILANMGVEDEYGSNLPAARVLAQKRALNFILEEPTLLKYIDATMALHNEGVQYLISHPERGGLINPPAELEERLIDLTRKNGSIGNELNLI